jgi:hypothetical protein
VQPHLLYKLLAAANILARMTKSTSSKERWR